jgi:hypothetical protein
VLFEQNRVLVLAQTWNHLSRLLTAEDQNMQVLDAELKMLSPDEYSQYKFVRKSQGDHRTREDALGVALGTIAVILYVTIPAAAIYLFKKPKRSAQNRI